jgi:hypothetical protein
MQPLPLTAILLGLAGLIPVIGCAGGALVLQGDKAASYLYALVAYAAVILSFLGAVHWGLALVLNPALPGHRMLVARRLAGSVIPSLLGWAALLLHQAMGATTALIVLIVGFAATLSVERGIARAGGLPRGYMRLRWTLSTVVLLTLGLTTIVRIMGLRLIF